MNILTLRNCHPILVRNPNYKSNNPMKKATFFHAGCPVCVSAEKELVNLLDPSEVEIEIIHLGEQTNKISNAKEHGVVSVPALVLDNQVFHINYGASIEDINP